MSKIKCLRFRVPVAKLAEVRERLLTIGPTAGFEKYTGTVAWRISDGLSPENRCSVLAYKSGSIVVSGEGQRFDLTSRMLKTYNIVKAKQ